jgi:hypothetical protein
MEQVKKVCLFNCFFIYISYLINSVLFNNKLFYFTQDANG